MLLLKKILLALFPLIILLLVVFFMKAPVSWTEATTLQILSLFIPLLLFFIFLSNILFSYLPHAFLAGLGIMFIVVLQASNQLNILTAILVIVTTILAIRFFPKLHYRLKLTKRTKIPKISQLSPSSSSRRRGSKE